MKRYAPIVTRRRSGFTIIEIVAVLLLLGVLAVGAVSVLPASQAGLATEAHRLSSHLRYAQIRAQADTYQWRVVFTDTQTYQIGPMIIPGAGFSPAIIPGMGGTLRTMTAGVTTTAGTAIQFDSWGRPVSVADQTITLTEGDRNATITIRAGTGLIP